MWELSDSFVVLRESEAFQGAGDVDLAVHLPRQQGGGLAHLQPRLVWAPQTESSRRLVKFVISTVELIRNIKRLLS